MEPFVDGGLFEIIIALGIAYGVNFIFLKKYLLISYSIVTLIAPVLITLLNRGDIYYILICFCFLNGSLLIALLWKERSQNPGKPLFDIAKFQKRILKRSSN